MSHESIIYQVFTFPSLTRVSKKCSCQLCHIATIVQPGKKLSSWKPLEFTRPKYWAVPKGRLRKTSVPSGNVDQRCETCGEPKKPGMHKGPCNRTMKYQNLDNTLTPCSKQLIASKYLSEKVKEANERWERVSSISWSSGGWPLLVYSDKNPPSRAKKQLEHGPLISDIFMDVKTKLGLNTRQSLGPVIHPQGCN